MRDIKFRAWDGKKFYKPIICRGEVYREERDLEDGISYNDDVMQFTGLLDKDGKEIYEGDIVDVFPANDSKIYCQVEIRPSGVSLRKWKYWMSDKLYEFNNSVSIIGNIYENPELLSK